MAVIDFKSVNPWMQPGIIRVDPCLNLSRNLRKTDWGEPAMSDPSELLPVNRTVFQAVTEANGSFEELVADLEALQQVSFFPTDKLMGYMNVICRIRAELNMSLMEKIAHREEGNALYFDRLCIRRERELKDPDDVVLDAERRKKEIEEEKKRLEGQEPLPAEDLM